MMNNKDNFKKAMDNVHAPEELKNKTFEKIKNNPKKNNLIFIKILCSICFSFWDWNFLSWKSQYNSNG